MFLAITTHFHEKKEADLYQELSGVVLVQFLRQLFTYWATKGEKTIIDILPIKNTC